VLVVYFLVTFLAISTAMPQVLEPQYEIDLIVLDDDEELTSRPMLDPDFEIDLRNYCNSEDIDTSHLDEEE
jgi:hypothetical protein